MWANDHGDEFPMALSNDKGGSRESALAGNPIPSFLVISNELNSPKVLLCQHDTNRGPRVGLFEGLAARNVSYLIGIGVSETNAFGILSGDRNIVLADLKQRRGLLEISDSNAAQWSNEIHNQQGNIALVDGSARQITQTGLRKALEGTGLATNRFAIP
jgi:prepilin-type processing-associated H-X9-DG protein